MAFFGPIFQSVLRGGKTKSATKCFERSTNFRYGMPKDIFIIEQKTGKGGGRTAMGERVKCKICGPSWGKAISGNLNQKRNPFATKTSWSKIDQIKRNDPLYKKIYLSLFM